MTDDKLPRMLIRHISDTHTGRDIERGNILAWHLLPRRLRVSLGFNKSRLLEAVREQKNKGRREHGR